MFFVQQVRPVAALVANVLLTVHRSTLLALLEVAPDGQFLVGKGCLEEETGGVADDEDDEMAIDT